MATDDWQVNGTGGWLAAADWSTGSVPATGDDVLIGTNNHTAIVKSAADVTIHTLEITPGDWLELNGGNFVVTDGLPFGMFGFIEVDSANFQIDGGTINNSATIDLTPSSNVTTDLTIFNTVQLNGAGSIVFAGDGNDGILGGTSAASLTNFDNNISGTGFIEGLVFTNYATIETNNSLGAGTLRIVGSAYGGSFDNENLLLADNGGTIELGDWAGTASSTILLDDGAIALLSTGAVTTLEIANSVTITTTFGDGLIGLDGTDPANDKIVSNGKSASLTLGAHITLLNTGTIGDANLTLTNEGDIDAIGHTLVINTGANAIINTFGAQMEAFSNTGVASYLDIQSGVQNSGSIFAGPKGLVTIDRASSNGGDIDVGNGGEIIVNSSIFGLSGSGIEIGGGGLLDLGHGGTVSQGVEFTGAGGTLELDQDAGQIGTEISGLTVADSIDLGFLGFAAGDHAVWTQTGGGDGTISVEAANNSLLATLLVEGTWNSQDFTVTSGIASGNNNAVEVTVKGAGSPSSASADLIMHNSGGGQYEFYDLGNNTIVSAVSLPLLGAEWQVAGLGGFFGSDTSDMLMRDSNTGAFEVYDISNNNITNAAAMGQVGLEWTVAGFGNFSGNPGETDMLMRNSNTGQFEIYDVANNAITFAAPMGQVGKEWSVAGFGDFSTQSNETDMLMRNTSTGQLEFYDISNNQITSAGPVGQVGLEWSAAGFGDFSGNANETDMLMRNNNTGAFELYDISNNQITSAAPLGQVGLEWQVVGFGPINGAGASDMLMRNSITGSFEIYDITDNGITSAASMGQVGLEWSAAGIAADSPNSQLVQAMASMLDPAGGALDTAAQLGSVPVQSTSATVVAAQMPHASST